MLKLSYTKADLKANTQLQNTVQTLMMLGGTVSQGPTLSFGGIYTIDTELLPFVDTYKCMIKMSSTDWNGNVYSGLSETTQTFSEWKASNFDDPISDKLGNFVYVPSDIVGRELTGNELNIFLTNGCELLSIDEYNDRIRNEYPQENAIEA